MLELPCDLLAVVTEESDPYADLERYGENGRMRAEGRKQGGGTKGMWWWEAKSIWTRETRAEGAPRVRDRVLSRECGPCTSTAYFLRMQLE